MKPELEGISVVFIGSFNPAIFHPEWFARQQLIPEPDLKSSAVEVVTRELALVNIGAIRLVAQPQRFQLETASLDLLPVLRDLCLGTFQQLAHTPVTGMGFNRHLHFRMTTDNDWHTVGHLLAPKTLWNGVMDEPGMLGVHMQGKRPGSPAEYARIQVEPSSKVRPGVYVSFNEHYVATEEDDSLSTLLHFLQSEWEPAQEYGRTAAISLLGKCLGGNDE